MCGCGHGIPPKAVGGLVVVAVVAGASGVRQAAAGIRAAVEVAAITGLSLGGLALLAVLAFGLHRLYASRPPRLAPYRVEVTNVTPANPAWRPSGRLAAIEAPRPYPASTPPADDPAAELADAAAELRRAAPGLAPWDAEAHRLAAAILDNWRETAGREITR